MGSIWGLLGYAASCSGAGAYVPRINKRLVEAAEVRTKGCIICDNDPAGFAVRVLPSGKPCYIVQNRIGARYRRMSPGALGWRCHARRAFADVLLRYLLKYRKQVFDEGGRHCWLLRSGAAGDQLDHRLAEELTGQDRTKLAALHPRTGTMHRYIAQIMPRKNELQLSLDVSGGAAGFTLEAECLNVLHGTGRR